MRMTCIFEEKTVKFFLAILHTHAIARVDDPYKSVGLLEVVAPIWSEGALPADVPCSE